ncbi:AraC-like ligand binding domain-containing protein [Alkalispirochaeta americana]|uniref:AraC-like ligand binding domain-containing protein n=1 Tax=Alkalispirochaeta americana TaxID=159291 RepID=A0A1N6N5I8_9SPIO|nr:helix-turn-helix domain-containing protein [Alkalispirochaeta americana]SIP87337.1 AraC-like ligand binding domain-containing protein [Alkalispirochaeta americana]
MEIKDVVFVYRLSSPELLAWHSRHHSHDSDEYELHFFLGGEGRFERDRDRFVLSQGRLFFSPPGERHAIRPEAESTPVSYYALLFTPASEDPLRGILDDDLFRQAFPRDGGARQRLLFEDCKNGFAHPHPARRQAAAHLLQAFLWELAAEISPGDKPAPWSRQRRISRDRPEDYNVHISRAIRLFEQHLRERISMEAVADSLDISREHLTRLFTQHLGVSPLQYYRRLRMDVATSLLLDTTLSIKEIAWELGYQNPFHFSRSFRRYAQMSPRTYRQQYYRQNPTGYDTRMVKPPEGSRSRGFGDLPGKGDDPPRQR